MKRRTQKSQKRAKFLFILIILTAILSITATYAWFSTQRDVEITGLKVRVESAENLQISLDGENWAQTITIEDMKQLYGTYDDDTNSLYQADADENRNYVPIELLPVSTVGTLATNQEGGDVFGTLQFVKGDVDGTTLKNIKACNELDIKAGAAIATKEAANENHPYLVFDLYLRNLSRRTEVKYTSEDVDKTLDGVKVTSDMVGKVRPISFDELRLNKGSKVWIQDADNDGNGVTGTGLEYSSRIAFVPYGNTADLTADGETVRALAGDGTEKVSIWEPNFRDHTQYVVDNNKRGIEALQEAVADATKTYPVLFTMAGKTGTAGEIDTTKTPDTGKTKDVTTVRATYDTTGTTEEKTLVTPDGTDKLTLKPNQISKVRVYLYLEGQDPDCIDLASTGKELSATIKLVKPVFESEDQFTYDN